jgi:BirA family biotin operon repressor/biotin-[acetyl-CoA-carboxylase] ligase
MHNLVVSPLDGAPIHHLRETTSTMDDARRLVGAGAPSGTIVVADYQSVGRGRRTGRLWQSPPRESLMFTIAFERPDEPVTRSLAFAVAVAGLLEERFELAVAVKWPNDVLVVRAGSDDRDRASGGERGSGGARLPSARKVCGILADYEAGWLYLGVGLNLRQERFPPELAGVATSVRIERARLRSRALPDPDWADAAWEELRDAMLADLLRRFGEIGPAWHDELSARLWMRGAEVEVALPGGGSVTGRLERVERDGRLVVHGERVHRLAAGEVSFSRDANHEQ